LSVKKFSEFFSEFDGVNAYLQLNPPLAQKKREKRLVHLDLECG